MRFAYVLLGLVSLASVHTLSGTAHDTMAAQDVGYPTCGGDVIGLLSGNVCCAIYCGICENQFCFVSPYSPEDCCPYIIESTGVPCSTTLEGPCVLDEELCSNGVPGVQYEDICCESQCGTCGGYGCDLRPGGGDACCSGTITNSGVMCSATSEAPCIIDD